MNLVDLIIKEHKLIYEINPELIETFSLISIPNLQKFQH